VPAALSREALEGLGARHPGIHLIAIPRSRCGRDRVPRRTVSRAGDALAKLDSEPLMAGSRLYARDLDGFLWGFSTYKPAA